MTEANVRAVVDEAVHESRDRTGRVAIVTGGVVGILGLCLLGTVTLHVAERNDALERRAEDATRVAQVLAAQVEQLGGTPAVQPPEPGRAAAQAVSINWGATCTPPMTPPQVRR